MRATCILLLLTEPGVWLFPDRTTIWPRPVTVTLAPASPPAFGPGESAPSLSNTDEALPGMCKKPSLKGVVLSQRMYMW